MATEAASVSRGGFLERETVAAKILRLLGKAPVNVLLIAVGLLWLVPTFSTAVLYQGQGRKSARGSTA